MALAASGIAFRVREVKLRDKPPRLLAISPKATVPVLQLPSGEVIEESLEIVHWALQQGDPLGWADFDVKTLGAMDALIERNDHPFKDSLDRYKYADRHPQQPQQVYRAQAEPFLVDLESRLNKTSYLFGDRASYADIAIFPFVRQFSKVEQAWFDTSRYRALRAWLTLLTDGDLFQAIMAKYAPWSETDTDIVFKTSDIARAH